MMTSCKEVDAERTLLQAYSAISSVAPGWKAVEFRLSLLTPMYGGGRSAKETDLGHPLRGRSIRRGLRWWWRLLAEQGALPESAHFKAGRGLVGHDLYAAEVKRFGGRVADDSPGAGTAPGTSPGLVRVRAWVDGTAGHSTAQQVGWHSVPAYVHGLLGSKLKKAMQLPAANLTGTLQVELRSDAATWLEPEVMMALRWWAEFAGVGARTRRGMGCVVLQRVVAGRRVELDAVTADEATRAGCLLHLRGAKSSCFDTWKDLIEVYAAFRNQRLRPLGANLWPDADMARQLVHLHGPAAGQRPEGVPIPVEAEVRRQWVHREAIMPRSALGLPLGMPLLGPVSQVRHRRQEEQPEHDLGSVVVRPRDGDSMASPLILRVRQTAQEEFRGVVLLLPLRFRNEALGVALSAAWTPAADRRQIPMAGGASNRLRQTMELPHEHPDWPQSGLVAWRQNDGLSNRAIPWNPPPRDSPTRSDPLIAAWEWMGGRLPQPHD